MRSRQGVPLLRTGGFPNRGSTGLCLPALLLVISCAAGLAADAGSFRLIRERQLVSVATAAPDILVLVFHDHDENVPPSQIVEDYAVNGSAPRKVARVTATLYEERCVDWRAQRYPQLLEHRLYLALRVPLVEGQACEVRFPGGATSLVFRSGEMTCESFKVNPSGTSLRTTRSMFTSRVSIASAAGCRWKSRSRIGNDRPVTAISR
jgi:hypothetical protein